MKPVSDVKLLDCMEGMKAFPDKYFDLAIVDPPYGLGKKLTEGGGSHLKFKNHKEIQNWDIVPEKSYFDELFRVSKNQIIWGGNYFNLGPCRGFIVWDKLQSVPNFSACEFAWTSFDTTSKIFKYRQAGCFGETKIHPTQKPVKLYNYCLHTFAQPADKILDTHLGSGSSRIASYNMGFDFWGFEIDNKYYLDQEKRFIQETSQQSLFGNQSKAS